VACGLWPVDRGPWTVDCGLWTDHINFISSSVFIAI